MSVEVPEESVIVGQPALVRVKVLVPTFMPSPPVFPSLEQENLLVRLPERASGPVSDTVDGKTWSGVQRSYRLYPLTPGQLDFGEQDVEVTFADPDTNKPVQSTVTLPKISLSVEVPEGAQGLDPLIIANGFELNQDIEGPSELHAGDAITRKLTANIYGTSSILIPPLLADLDDPLLKAYPKDPRFSESEDRGILSGQRVDEVVYLAQAAGNTTLPPVTLRWYNLESDSVETAEVPAIDLQLTGPAKQQFDIRNLLQVTPYVIFFTLVLAAVFRLMVPWYRRRRKVQAQIYNASPEFALAQLRTALNEQDLSKAYSALDLWKSRTVETVDTSVLERHLAAISATRYAATKSGAEPDWPGAIAAIGSLSKSTKRKPTVLPPLNP
ncbi:hypothetical protein NBRC116589_02430 [Ruegeria sp. HU-ET01832]|uniref:hypothetical protein n=1 Tax=Ruegeria sp. HU-ET01832 TaxID=3135906 RepID=UPI0031078A76